MADSMDTNEPEWYAALGLQERASLWRAHHATSLPRTTPTAEWRLSEWRRQEPFTDTEVFRRRVRSAGLTIEEFERITSVPNELLRDWHVESATWLALLESVLRRCDDSQSAQDGDTGTGFDQLLAPFLAEALSRLDAALRQCESTSMSPQPNADVWTEVFLPPLRARLTAIVGRALTLELNVARLDGVLLGATPVDRFRSFVSRLRRPDQLTRFLREYAVAARLIANCTEEWIRSSSELVSRVARDAALLETTFLDGAPLGTVSTAVASGDQHAGRSVTIVEFSSGLRLAYKPRALAVDEAFYSLLAWINERSAALPFRRLRILDRSTHGWVEFVQAEFCTSDDSVERFYERLGGLLAVLHVLDGQDMHMENVIAAADQPVIVDLEALFHPPAYAWTRDVATKPDDGLERGSDSLRFLQDSVMRTGLLPQRIWTDDDQPGVDVSAIGGGGAPAPHGRVIQLQDRDTDVMRAERVKGHFPAALNQPRAPAKGTMTARLAAAVDRGFATVYDTLIEHRSALIAECRAKFAGATVRVITRPTSTYASLLHESYHPDLLRDALDRERFFDHLWLATAVRRPLESIIGREHDSLQRGDIPLFHARPDSRDLESDQEFVLKDFFESSGLERVIMRIGHLNPVDRERQRWVVRAALSTLVEDSTAGADVDTPSNADLSPTLANRDIADSPSRDSLGTLDRRLAEEACRVGDRLCASVLRGDGTASWLAVTRTPSHGPVICLAGPDMYGGLPGILHFLAQLRTITRNDRYDDVGEAAFATLVRLLGNGELRVNDCGAFSGLGGLLHVLGHLELLWPSLPAGDLAARTLRRLGDVVRTVRSPFVFDGVAGALLGALSYSATTGSADALIVAVRCGDRLLAEQGAWAGDAPPSGAGGGSRAGRRGFESGTTGILCALARLTTSTADQQYANVAVHRSRELLYGEAASDGKSLSPVGALRRARARTLAALDFSRAGDAASRAALPALCRELTTRMPVLTNDSIATGRFGLVDLLLAVDAEIPGRSLQPALLDARDDILASARCGGWRCDVPLGVETPGLMNGLAGFGCGVLRLVAPDRFPSILLMDPSTAQPAPPNGQLSRER